MMQKRTGSLSMIASTNAQEVVNNYQVDEVHGRYQVPGCLPWYQVWYRIPKGAKQEQNGVKKLMS